MLRRVLIGGVALALAVSLAALPAAPAADAPATTDRLTVDEFRLGEAQTTELRQRFLDRVAADHAPGTWAPLRMELEDADLALMGLPPKHVLLAQRYPKPTTFDSKGKPEPAANSGTAAFAGAGFFGIRPGGWLLLLNGGDVGWCSFAHVYGSPGNYSISTAGHCGKVGDIATVIGVVGNRTPVLMDIGKFSKSTDGGLGNDWALISIRPEYQHLVTPTMAFWGGPIGMYTAQGDLASVSFSNRLVPSVAVDPNPFLAQQLVHYGHGTGVGAGGTPRSATAISWRQDTFMFFGAISPGDSGSGSNTLTGDSLGANREAAGINTHLYVDLLMRQGLGIMGGTRATKVSASLANGQLLPYPAPAPILP